MAGVIYPSPKNGTQGDSVKKAAHGCRKRVKTEPMIIRDLQKTFGTRLRGLNVNTTVTARLLGHGDLQSVYRYERGKEIMRQAVGLL
jgi:integrase